MSDYVSKLELFEKAKEMALSLSLKRSQRMHVTATKESFEICRIFNSNFLIKGGKMESSNCTPCVLRVMDFFLSKSNYEHYKNNPF